MQRSLERKEHNVTASALRTKNYVLERLLKESQQADSDSSRIRALELLGKTVAMFSDVVEERKGRDMSEIEQDIETKLEQLLASNE